jgi:HlyD family type I secretion membrane fusion protein
MNDLIEVFHSSSPAPGGTPNGVRVPSYPISSRGLVVSGCVLIALCFGSLTTWSYSANLSTAAIASGVVAVDSHRKSVQHLQGGIIREILVRDGQHVAAGDVLVRLEPTQLNAMVGMLQGKVDLAQAEEARMMAERLSADSFEFPRHLVERSRTEPELDMILGGQRRIFETRLETLSGQTSILRNRIAQSKQQIQALRMQEEAKLTQSALIEKELSGLRGLAKRGNAPANKVLQYEREAERISAERGEIVSNMAMARQSIGEAELQIMQTRRTFLEQVETDLRQTQSGLFEASQRLAAAQADLRRLEIRAPYTGTVVDMAYHTVDGVVTPGSRILDIIPDGERLVAEVQIRPGDIDGLAIGMPAQIRFTSFNQVQTPVMHGQVLSISADRLIDQKTGAPYYGMRVLVDADDVREGSALAILPGMPAEVVVEKHERTLFSYLIQPMRDTISNAIEN